MNKVKMASPLYILREQCTTDLFAVLRKLKNIGFEGIEFLGFFGHAATDVRDCLHDLELSALGNHVPFQILLQDTSAILDFHATVGCKYLTVADLGASGYPGSPTWDQTLAGLHKLGAEAQKYGISLLYHNHDFELTTHVADRELLDAILSSAPKEALSFEPDLGWIEIGGGNCEYYLSKYADRCPVIHLKDYYSSDQSEIGAVRDFLPQRGGSERGHFEFRPVGYGILNLAKLMPLCLACAPDWFVMDHDLAYERDSFADLQLSLDYVKALLSL